MRRTTRTVMAVAVAITACLVGAAAVAQASGGPPDTQTDRGDPTAAWGEEIPVVGRGGEVVGHLHRSTYFEAPAYDEESGFDISAQAPVALVYDDDERVVGVFGQDGFVELDEARELGLLDRAK